MSADKMIFMEMAIASCVLFVVAGLFGVRDGVFALAMSHGVSKAWANLFALVAGIVSTLGFLTVMGWLILKQ